MTARPRSSSFREKMTSKLRYFLKPSENVNSSSSSEDKPSAQKKEVSDDKPSAKKKDEVSLRISKKIPPPSGKQELDLLLVGKTGHGKSATGNSILQRQEFESSASSGSVTSKVKVAWAEVDGYVVKVIDGPGIGDTRFDTLTAKEKACIDMADAITLCPKGFHALLLVFKFGNRFTTEEQEAIETLKNIFGSNIIKDYGVIVMTHGDLFDVEYCDNEKFTFRDWLKQQQDPVKQLFEECDYRCVLFSNKTRNADIKQQQNLKLFALVKQLKNREARYTSDLFAMGKNQRDHLRVEAKLPKLQEIIMRETSLIIADLSRIRASDQDLEKHEMGLKILEDRVSGLLKTVTDEDSSTGVLEKLKEHLRSVLMSIELERKLWAERKKWQDQNKQEQEDEYRRALHQNNERWSKLLYSVELNYKNNTDNLRKCMDHMERKMRVKESKLKAELEKKRCIIF